MDVVHQPFENLNVTVNGNINFVEGLLVSKIFVEVLHVL